METPLRVVEKNQPKIVFSLWDAENPDQPYDSTGSTFKLILKASRTASDASGTTYTEGDGITTQVPPVSPTMNVICQFGDVFQSAGRQWYHLDATKAGKLTTLVYGPVYVEDV